MNTLTVEQRCERLEAAVELLCGTLAKELASKRLNKESLAQNLLIIYEMFNGEEGGDVKET